MTSCSKKLRMRNWDTILESHGRLDKVTSAGIIFLKFLELHSTISAKNVFLTNFPFLTDQITPNPPPLPPLNDQNPLSVKKAFCQWSLIFHVVLVGIPSILIVSFENRGREEGLLKRQNSLSVTKVICCSPLLSNSGE